MTLQVSRYLVVSAGWLKSLSSLKTDLEIAMIDEDRRRRTRRNPTFSIQQKAPISGGLRFSGRCK